ncbi:MAG: TRAP transporter TatT component family protein [Treponemataceae bacterium]
MNSSFFKVPTRCIIVLIVACSLVSCASVANNISTALSGANQKGIIQKKKQTATDPMIALTGETDTILMGDFFPVALKMYEIMQAQNPKHQGLAIMTGSLYVMYANAFVQHNAEMLNISQFSLKHKEIERAKMHYLRGRALILSALDLRYKDFSSIIFAGDEEQFAQLLSQLKKNDVDSLYWLSASWLGAFSLNPLDPEMTKTVKHVAQLLEKAAYLDPDYNDGAIWDILTSFLASAPQELGGDKEKAVFAYQEALRVSKGKTVGPYITYATAFSIPENDSKGFDEAIDKALSINPDDNPSTRFATTIAQKKAQWLKDNKDDFIIDWGE